MSHRQIITKGDLPHWYMPGAAHFVTYRLADTLPVEVLLRLRAERDARLRQPPIPGVSLLTQKAQAHKQFFVAYDRYLDRGSSIRWLENPDVAEANKVLSRHGRFWQRESYDHWVRDEAELSRIAWYIANNAVSASLAENATDWPYCSAFDRKNPRDKRLAEW